MRSINCKINVQGTGFAPATTLVSFSIWRCRRQRQSWCRHIRPCNSGLIGHHAATHGVPQTMSIYIPCVTAFDRSLLHSTPLQFIVFSCRVGGMSKLSYRGLSANRRQRHCSRHSCERHFGCTLYMAVVAAVSFRQWYGRRHPSVSSRTVCSKDHESDVG